MCEFTVVTMDEHPDLIDVVDKLANNIRSWDAAREWGQTLRYRQAVSKTK